MKPCNYCQAPTEHRLLDMPICESCDRKRPLSCVVCGCTTLLKEMPGGDIACWDVTCKGCGMSYEVHFDGCVVRDRLNAEIRRLQRITEEAVDEIQRLCAVEDRLMEANDKLDATVTSLEVRLREWNALTPEQRTEIEIAYRAKVTP
jgi:hypothetical protein